MLSFIKLNDYLSLLHHEVDGASVLPKYEYNFINTQIKEASERIARDLQAHAVFEGLAIPKDRQRIPLEKMDALKSSKYVHDVLANTIELANEMDEHELAEGELHSFSSPMWLP